MKTVHRTDEIRMTITHKGLYLDFHAIPIEVLVGEAGNAKWTKDYFNWKVQSPWDIANDNGKQVLENKGFKDAEEIMTYVKRFEDPGIEDIETVDKSRRTSW